jgi:hypothetical protein
MTPTQNGQGATIIQFPVGGRAAFRAGKDQVARELPRAVVDVHGWYHDDAIRDEDVTKTH